jgi:hypothetical protein
LPIVAGLVASGVSAGWALAQPTDNIGEDLAEILLHNGCEMGIDAAGKALEAKGLGAGDFDAQYRSLGKGDYIVWKEKTGRIRLVNWGSCK